MNFLTYLGSRCAGERVQLCGPSATLGDLYRCTHSPLGSARGPDGYDLASHDPERSGTPSGVEGGRRVMILERPRSPSEAEGGWEYRNAAEV